MWDSFFYPWIWNRPDKLQCKLQSECCVRTKQYGYHIPLLDYSQWFYRYPEEQLFAGLGSENIEMSGKRLIG